jgi:hypothetical protein
MTPKEFALFIDKEVHEKSITYIDAIVEYCDKRQLETNQIKHLINRSLKEKIRVNAEAVNLLQKSTNTLPI